jgi:DNA-dependent RNA polymerase auxiliary subunit epsilon
LEKQLQDAQLAYDKAALQSSTVQDDARQQLEKAKYDLENLSDKS